MATSKRNSSLLSLIFIKLAIIKTNDVSMTPYLNSKSSLYKEISAKVYLNLKMMPWRHRIFVLNCITKTSVTRIR